MTIFNYALIIRDMLDAERVLDYYGVAFNRAGFALCPFHSEKTASLKINNPKQWHCFGCGKTGDVIDFVIERFDLKWSDAIEKLNTDFGLNLPIGKRVRLADSMQISKRCGEIESERERVRLQYESDNEAYESMWDTYATFDCAIMRLNPKPGDTKVDPFYLYALSQIEHYKYLIKVSAIPVRG